MTRYSVQFKKSARKELLALDEKLRIRIVKAVEALAETPRPKASLKLEAAAALWRIRVGNYRVLYEIKDDILLVYVVKVAHRKEVYRFSQ